jgi:hypothetical protein
MTVPNTLADITLKVRRLTGRPSPDQITDATIQQYINTYYLYDLPETLRLLKLKDTLTFTTIPNVEVYPVNDIFPTLGDTAYITFEPPAYVAGQQIQYFQDLDLFYREWPKNNYIQQIATGSSIIGDGPYTGNLTAFPLLSSISPVGSDSATAPIGQDIRILFSANIANQQCTSAYDDGEGGWIDAVSGDNLEGSINYITGAFTITFSEPIPAGAQINASYIPYVASLPRCMVFYQNQFILRPIPDKAYIVEINAFRYPTALASSGSQPELNFWWQLLAYGAALKILVDNADYDNAERLRPYFNEQLLIVQRRTIKQQTNQRTSTIYSQDGATYGFGNLYPYI